MIKYACSLLVLLTLLTEARAQQSAIDSLDRLLRQVTTDTARINLSAEKISRFLEINLDSAVNLAEKTLVQAQRIHYRKGEGHTRRLLAFGYAYQGQYVAAQQHLQRAEETFRLLKEDTGLCRVYSGYGMLYGLQSQYDSSIVYYDKVITLAQRINNQDLLNGAYQNIAISYQMQSRHAQALSYLQRALQFYEKQHDENSQAYIALNMGLTYSGMSDTLRAEQSLLTATRLARKVGVKNVELYAYSNLATLYDGEGKYALSYQNAMKAADLAAELGDLSIQAASLAKAASALAFQHQYRQAEQLDQQAIAIADSARQPLSRYQAFATMGLILKLQQRYQAAIPYLEQGFRSIQQGNVYDEAFGSAYATLSECYEKTGDFQKALAAYKVSAQVNDSVRGKENIRKATELTMNYAFEKKQQATRADQQRQNALAKTRQRALLAGLGLTVLLAVVVFYAYANKRKANTLLEQQKQEIQQTLLALQAVQAQLIQQEKMASLGELTAGIAHEIQNPLNFVNNFAEVSVELVEEMKEEVDRETLDKAYLKGVLDDLARNQQKIHHHGQRADAIVKGMLQHSRASTGEKQLTDLNTLAEEYLRLAYQGMRAKNQEFNANLVTDLDPGLQPVSLVPQEMGRVLLNLFNNAFYATQQKKRQLDGHYQPQVRVFTKQQGDKVTLTVADNGVGIPESVKRKIFQPFFTTKPTGQGTGLGLSLSYEIITKGHGGELKLESQSEQGAEFTVILPTK